MKYLNTKIVLLLSFIGALNGCTSLMITDEMVQGIHKEMDTNNDGYINYQEYLSSGSKNDFVKGAREKGMTVDEFKKWEFNRADENRDGKITKEELINLARKES